MVKLLELQKISLYNTWANQEKSEKNIFKIVITRCVWQTTPHKMHIYKIRFWKCKIVIILHNLQHCLTSDGIYKY